MSAITHPLVEEYLRDFKRASSSLTRLQQQELLADVQAHFEAALAGSESDDAIREVIAAFGSPDDVLAPYLVPDPPKTGRIALILGVGSVLALLAPPFAVREYGRFSLALAALATFAGLLAARKPSSTGTVRRRGYLALGLSLTSVLTVAVVQMAFVPDLSIGVAVTAPINGGENTTQLYNLGKKCAQDDLKVTLQGFPPEGKQPEAALLTIGNTSSSLCSIEGPLSIRVGQADGQEVTAFTQDCWSLPLQNRCSSGTLKASANFKGLLDAPVGYVSFWIKGKNDSAGHPCPKSTAPRYFRIVAAGIDWKLLNSSSSVSTCNSSVGIYPHVRS